MFSDNYMGNKSNLLDFGIFNENSYQTCFYYSKSSLLIRENTLYIAFFIKISVLLDLLC